MERTEISLETSRASVAVSTTVEERCKIDISSTSAREGTLNCCCNVTAPPVGAGIDVFAGCFIVEDRDRRAERVVGNDVRGLSPIKLIVNPDVTMPGNVCACSVAAENILTDRVAECPTRGSGSSTKACQAKARSRVAGERVRHDHRVLNTTLQTIERIILKSVLLNSRVLNTKSSEVCPSLVAFEQVVMEER